MTVWRVTSEERGAGRVKEMTALAKHAGNPVHELTKSYVVGANLASY